MRLANRDLNHGFQARYPSPTTLAPVERIGSDTKSSYWSNFRRRRRVRTTSCLTYFKSRGAPAPRTQLLTISPPRLPINKVRTISEPLRNSIEFISFRFPRKCLSPREKQRTPGSFRNLGFINSGNVLLSHNL